MHTIIMFGFIRSACICTHTHAHTGSVRRPGAAQDVGHIIMAHVCMDVYVCIYIYKHAYAHAHTGSVRGSRSSTRCLVQHHGAGALRCVSLAPSAAGCVTLCVPRSISSWVRYVVCPSLHQQLNAVCAPICQDSCVPRDFRYRNIRVTRPAVARGSLVMALKGR